MSQCAICGGRKRDGQFWFLVAESPLRDRLKVLAWEDEVERVAAVLSVCSTQHVRELVVQWMAGDPSYEVLPFEGRFSQFALGSSVRVYGEPDTGTARELAELNIDREAINRALDSSPRSLEILLDELTDVLEREAAGTPTRFESADSISYLRQI